MIGARYAVAKSGRPETGPADPVEITNAEAAAKVEVSEMTIKRAKKVIKDGVPALAEMVKANKISVAAAARYANAKHGGDRDSNGSADPFEITNAEAAAEVEEIVEGVRILGGNPSEQEAKQASRAQRAREMKAQNPEMTQREIAREVGVTQQAVNKALKPDNQKPVKPKKVVKTPVVGLALDPAVTARNIVAKMGREYAVRLCAAVAPEARNRTETAIPGRFRPEVDD